MHSYDSSHLKVIHPPITFSISVMVMVPRDARSRSARALSEARPRNVNNIWSINEAYTYLACSSGVCFELQCNEFAGDPGALRRLKWLRFFHYVSYVCVTPGGRAAHNTHGEVFIHSQSQMNFTCKHQCVHYTLAVLKHPRQKSWNVLKTTRCSRLLDI